MACLMSSRAPAPAADRTLKCSTAPVCWSASIGRWSASSPMLRRSPAASSSRPATSTATSAVITDIGPNFTGGLFVAGGFFTNNKDQDGFVYADVVISADAGGNAHQTIYRLDRFVDPARRDDAIYIIANSPAGINDDTGLPEDV